MKKRILALLLASVMVFALAACSGGSGSATPAPTPTPAPAEEGVTLDNIKVGFVHISDPSDKGYTYNHDLGTQHMQAALGLRDDQVISKYNVPESAECDTAIRELVEAGCSIVFCTSFGFEDYMLAVAEEYPEVEFCHATGYQAAAAGLPNVHNYFGDIFEARYLSGIAAGLRTETNQLGYVTAMPFAECISGYTAFYLGAKSVNPDVTMKVIYTNNWNDPTAEAAAAQALIDAGCDVLCQHADSTATQTTCEANGVWGVGYNSDMIEAAPNAVLTSAVWDWGIYLQYAVNCVLSGEEIAVDWSGGIADGVCNVSALNPNTVAEGTEEAINAAREKIISGELYVFTGPLHGVGTDWDGKTVEINLAEGEKYIEPASAPSWNYVVDGVTVIG